MLSSNDFDCSDSEDLERLLLSLSRNSVTSVVLNAFIIIITYKVVLYRLPYFSHVPMSDYFIFQTTDISIQYRLLQTC